jgi:hypothetical protein
MIPTIESPKVIRSDNIERDYYSGILVSGEYTLKAQIKSNGGLVRVGASETHTLQGKIVCDTPGPEAGTFIGVESAVELYDRQNKKVAETKSSWEGNYTIKGVPKGAGYYIKASKPKYSDGRTASFAVPAVATAPELKLGRATFTVTGKMFGSGNSDGTGALPLAGAEVYVVSIGRAYKVLGGPAITDADGRYSVEATTDSFNKPFAAIAVKADGAAAEYGSQLNLKKESLALNLGMLYGIGPSYRVWPSGTQQYGEGGGYNFKINYDASLRTNRDVILTKTQEAHIRTAVKSNEHLYQLRAMDGAPVGPPVPSLGNSNGDDIIFNIPKGTYYIDVTRPGYAGMRTMPFVVGATRVFLRNAPNTNTMDVRAARQFTGKVVDEIGGKLIKGAELQFVVNDASGGLGIPVATGAKGEFAYGIPSGVACEVRVSAPGYATKTIAVASGAAGLDMSIGLRPSNR